MLKIMKYEYKSMIIIPLFIILFLLIIMLVALSKFSNSTGSSFVDLSFMNFAMTVYYIFANALVIGIMWKRSSKNIELFEMAEISPLKVGLSRMIIVFVVVSIISSAFMLVDTVIEKAYTMNASVNLFGAFIYNYYDYSTFSVYNLPWTNLLAPLFLGLYASILFTTSFLFATVTRRVNHRVISAFVLFALIVIYILFYYYVIRRINFLTPALNLNKFGEYGLIIKRFSLDKDSMLNYFYPNFLNVSLMIIYGLYVAIMFSVYSIRRKLV